MFQYLFETNFNINYFLMKICYNLSMKVISILIKPASALCNLKCRYCFYIDESKNRCTKSYGVMENSTIDKLVERIMEVVKNDEGAVNISFQGGEPTVAGLDYFRYFINAIKKHPNLKPNYSIQTNGTLLNDEWSKFFKENNFLIGVSLDGFKDNTNKFRLDSNNNGVFDKIMSGIKSLDKFDNEYNILTVLTRELARYPEELFKFYLENNFKYVQLIPCLPELNGDDNGMSLTPSEYSNFYISFFNLWKKEVLKGNEISINLFENIASMLMGQPPYQCGMLGRCSVQFVIESSGDVFPCDFYCLDENKLGSIYDSSFPELYKKGLETFVSFSKCSNDHCKTCKYVRICNGGCRRQNVCYLSENDCAYEKVLEHIVPEMYEMFKNMERK